MNNLSSNHLHSRWSQNPKKGFFTFAHQDSPSCDSRLHSSQTPHPSPARAKVTLLVRGQVSSTSKSSPFWPACLITWLEHRDLSLVLSVLLDFTTPVVGLLVIANTGFPFPPWLLASRRFPLVAFFSVFPTVLAWSEFFYLQATKTLTGFTWFPPASSQ